MNNKIIITIISLLTLLFISGLQAEDFPQPLSSAEFQNVLQSKDTLDWYKIKALTDEQAILIRESNGPRNEELKLEMRFGVKEIWLKGLTVLSENQARIFSRFDGAAIHLDGLKFLTEDQALLLGKFKGIYLETTVSDKSRVELESTKMPATMTLNGITDLSLKQAKYLGKSKAHMELNGITEVTDELAKVLGKSKYASLQLNGLKGLTEEQAKYLAKIKGKVDLQGINTLSLLYFIKFDGELMTPPDFGE